MTFHIYSSNPNSEGATALSEALGCRRIKHRNSRFRGGPGRTVINWGAVRLPELAEGTRIINKPAMVNLASNKLRFFEHVEAHGGDQILTPYWTTDYAEATRWLGEGKSVCARATVSGHSAEGLSIHSGTDVLPRVPLYTVYVPKRSEFRVHVINGNVVDTQQKVKRADFEGTPNWHVRNHDGGFIFQRHGIEVPECVHEQSRLVAACLPLDFMGIDIIWNERQNRAYVLECNTACGLAPETCALYAEHIRREYA